jgi:LruC domain-containing protein
MKKMSSTIIKGLIVAMLGIGIFSSTPSANAQTGIPAGATITSATLYIYSNKTNGYTVNAHRITAAWTELGVTWNNFNASYDPAVIDTLHLSAVPNWYYADITAVMQEWVDGTVPNYGVLLEQGRTPYTSYYSSEYDEPSLRPYFKICYTAAGISNTCVTIQRPGANHVEVFDSYIRDLNPDGNYGNDTILYTGLINSFLKQTLIRFDFSLLNPAVSIAKYTNGQAADDPDGADVPEIKPGDTVTWTYVVTNTGQVRVANTYISVTDDQIGVTPAYDHEINGNGDSVFDPGEVWLYKATGVAVDLTTPPAGVKVTQGVCTHNQTQPARTAYVNQGTASIPGASSTAKSSYCNPLQPAISIEKYTNGQAASDPDGADVPQIKPGDTVTWTYVVTNTGNVPVPAANVSVTDDQTGVTPAFDHVKSGNADTIFDPGEVWVYVASGVAVNLSNPPAGVKVTQGVCTHNQTQPARTAYVNQGTASLPGASSTAKSSYCNPLFKVYFPTQMGKPAFVVHPWHVAVGFEDLPLATGANDYDYNDWITDIDGFADYDVLANNGLSEIAFNFRPQARGAVFDHTFHIAIPGGTFGSDGTAVLTTFDQNHQVLSSQSSPFVASANTDFVIFPNTSDVFPELTNTYETLPYVPAQRYATLDITFNNPAPFDLTSYNFALPHGGGLFFDPYLYVHYTGEAIHRGDIRILTVPDVIYKWPEESIRIDKAYPNVTFVAGNPPTITFPNMWWLNYNHCVYDGVLCALSTTPSTGTVASGAPGAPVVTPGTPTATTP